MNLGVVETKCKFVIFVQVKIFCLKQQNLMSSPHSTHWSSDRFLVLDQQGTAPTVESTGLLSIGTVVEGGREDEHQIRIKNRYFRKLSEKRFFQEQECNKIQRLLASKLSREGQRDPGRLRTRTWGWGAGGGDGTECADAAFLV